MGFERDRLQAFIRTSEGDPPPVFAGRKEILRDISETADVAWKGEGASAHGAAKATRIIQGAPGAGKSAILAKLVSRFLGSDAETSAPRVVVLSSEMLSGSMPQALAAVRATAEMDQTSWFTRMRKALDGVSVSAGVAGFSLGLARHGDSRTPSDLFDLATDLPGDSWRFPMIIAIDEAQRFRGGPDTPHAHFLQSIHGASTGLPLTLVLAGLGDTTDRVRDMDLTRMLNIHDIGALAPYDVSYFMRASCRYFGMDPRGHEECLNALACPCEGWPRHLHFALRALGLEALRTEGDLSRVDWENTLNMARDNRIRYYRGQQSREMKGSSALVARVMRDVRPGDGKSDVVDSIERYAGSEPSSRWQLPETMTPRAFVDHLIHQGALHEASDQTLTCPIPSFRAYLVRVGGLTLRETSSSL